MRLLKVIASKSCHSVAGGRSGEALRTAFVVRFIGCPITTGSASLLPNRHMLQKRIAILTFIFILLGMKTAYSISPGDRIAILQKGTLLQGKVIELISGDSEAVVKLTSGKNIVVPTSEIAYAFPPMLDRPPIGSWQIETEKSPLQAVFVNMVKDEVYLQRADGTVLGVKKNKLSQASLALAQKQSSAKPVPPLVSGDAVELVVGKMASIDEQKIATDLTDALKRSGYRVEGKANAKLKVDFRKEKTETSEMIGLESNRIVTFTPTTAIITITVKDKLILKSSYTTKIPFTLPPGEAGEKKLRDAEVSVMTFFRTFSITPRIQDGI